MVDSSEIQAINSHASALMKRGIALLNEARLDAVVEALGCFDRALELRRGLPIHTDPLLRYGLAACWLNRADALVRLGRAADLPAALLAYDEGIALLRSLPMADDARFPRRLAIAYQNRGLALQVQNGPDAGVAIEAFTDAIAILEHEHAASIPDRRYLLAAVWTNLASARAAEATADAESTAREAVRRAMALIKDTEENDVAAAEVGLKARHVFCRTVAKYLSTAVMSSEPMPDEVHDATDAVDEGLAIVQAWERRGVAHFRALAYDLFRFGARVYAIYQPQFLAEFVAENVDPVRSSLDYVESAEMQAAAREAQALRG